MLYAFFFYMFNIIINYITNNNTNTNVNKISFINSNIWTWFN